MTRKKMNMNISRIVKTTIAVLIIVMMFGSTLGCAFTKTTAQEPTPALTSAQTPAPTLTPDPTPNPTPTIEITPAPTHAPELSLEEERALLGVKHMNSMFYFNEILIMYYTQKNENGDDVNRIGWVFEGKDLSDRKGIYNKWGEEKMYDIPMNASNRVREYILQVTPSNQRFVDSEVIAITSIYDLKDFYIRMGIEFELPNEMLTILSLPFDKMVDYSLPMTDAMNLYISCTPKEYRTTWMDFDQSLIPASATPTFSDVQG